MRNKKSLQEKGFVCCKPPSLAFVCLISRELKTASSGAYSPGAPVYGPCFMMRLLCADKRSYVVISDSRVIRPFLTRIQRFQRQKRQKRFLLFSAPYPLKKTSSSDMPIKIFIPNISRCLVHSGLRESTLDRKYARRMSLYRAFPFFFYQTESRSSGARYIPSPSFTPKAS